MQTATLHHQTQWHGAVNNLIDMHESQLYDEWRKPNKTKIVAPHHVPHIDARTRFMRKNIGFWWVLCDFLSSPATLTKQFDCDLPSLRCKSPQRCVSKSGNQQHEGSHSNANCNPPSPNRMARRSQSCHCRVWKSTLQCRRPKSSRRTRRANQVPHIDARTRFARRDILFSCDSTLTSITLTEQCDRGLLSLPCNPICFLHISTVFTLSSHLYCLRFSTVFASRLSPHLYCLHFSISTVFTFWSPYNGA